MIVIIAATCRRVRSMTVPLKMTEYRPAGRLGWYVRAFQVFSTTDPPAEVSVLDFGGGDVSVPVCFGDPVLVEKWGDAEVPSAAVVGPRRQATWLRFHGRVDQVNVSFFPGAAGAFIGLPMPELVNRMAWPDEVWPREFRDAVAALEPLTTEQRVSGLAALLLARLEPRREPPPQIREAVRLIQVHRGRVTVHWLASQVNLSVSQLERSFTRHVGVGPKELARHTRVCALTAEAATPPNPGWAALAAKYGYADQAHLARELRELIGLTPSSLARVGSDADFLQDALACRHGVFKPPIGVRQGRTRMPSQNESPALRVARAHVEAWSKKDWDTARSLLAPDVHVTATHNGPYPPATDLTGVDDYMQGLTAFAEPIVAGSVRELAGVGDDRNALLTLDLEEAFDPAGPAVSAPCSRLYFVEDGKIKTEQIVFYVGHG